MINVYKCFVLHLVSSQCTLNSNSIDLEMFVLVKDFLELKSSLKVSVLNIDSIFYCIVVLSNY